MKIEIADDGYIVIDPPTGRELRKTLTLRGACETLRDAGQCTYPHCKCVVQTSTSDPTPSCPLDLIWCGNPFEGKRRRR